MVLHQKMDLVAKPLSPRMPVNSANAPTVVDELMVGEALRGEGAAPTNTGEASV
jgi:hypothetical protein